MSFNKFLAIFLIIFTILTSVVFVLQSKIGVEESQIVKAESFGFLPLFHWVEGTQANDDGATRDYYNPVELFADGLDWRDYMGDWHDVSNVAQGEQPYALTTLIDDDTDKWVEWDVTNLVQEFVDGIYPNKGMFLRVLSGGTHNFCSKEYSDNTKHPQLVINDTITLTPEADTYLDPSTYQCFGDSETLWVGLGRNVLIRFNLDSITQGTSIQSAKLRLFTYIPQAGNADVGVFRSSQGHELPPSDPIMGLAATYLNDQGIEGDPDVYLFNDFETSDWQNDWTLQYGGYDTVLSHEAELLQSFQGKALRIRIPGGGTDGVSSHYYFKDKVGQEPEEVYFRYYLRFGHNWETIQGGKLPGIAGTSNMCGYGGLPADGVNCWSARGAFLATPPAGNPAEEMVPIGNYVYEADNLGGLYGVRWLWKEGYRGFLEKNRWYSIEQYVKMNSPGQNSGIMRTWVDGRLAHEKTNINFRNVDTLKIQSIWINILHGGTLSIPQDGYVYMDNVAIAKQYIGPMISLPPSPDIALTKSVLVNGQPATEASSGDELTYTIQYNNTDTAEARNVVITDNIPNGTLYITGSAQFDGVPPVGGTVNYDGTKVKWTIPSLAAGGQGTVTFKVTVE